MKKIFLVILTATMLVGCSGEVDSVNAENKNALKIKKDKEIFLQNISTYIITDTETDNEYIVVIKLGEGGGVAITPRLRD